VADEVPYQNTTQVQQLLAERVNAEAYGQSSRVEAVDKQLAGLGYVDPKKAAKARAEAAKAEEESSEAETRSQPPKGRTSRQQQQATTEGSKRQT
jgi:hypothetical protein